MNKKQTVVMWVGVIITFLMWAGAPRELTSYGKGVKDPETQKWSQNSEETYTQVLIKPASVFVNWTMTGIFASAMIYTLRTKKPKQADEKSE